MSTTDTGAAFEAWALTCDGNCNDQDLRKYSSGHPNHVVDGIDYINQQVERDWQVWQAATEAAKATGTAGELSEDAILNLAKAHGFTTTQILSRGPELIGGSVELHERLMKFGQACAEAARQLAPVVAASVDPDVPEALKLLSDVFDAWENGVDCYEDPEECAGFLGKAFQLDDEVFERCCALLNRRNPPRNAALAATAAPVLSDEQEGMPVTQEPKYGIRGNRLFNRASGEFIPEDEPVFIFRARDWHATGVLMHYKQIGLQQEHWEAVTKRLADFMQFSKEHPERMKEPDTATRSQP